MNAEWKYTCDFNLNCFEPDVHLRKPITARGTFWPTHINIPFFRENNFTCYTFLLYSVFIDIPNLVLI